MRTMLMTVCLGLACVAGPAFAQQVDVEGSKDHPLVPRLPGYFIGNYFYQEFDGFAFQLGETEQRVEGRHWVIDYWLKEGARRSGPLEISRNYTNAFQKRGARIMFQEPGGYNTVMRLASGEGSLWCQVTVANDGDIYAIRIVEEARMEQQLELTSAELARLLGEQRSVALHDILFESGKATLKTESEKQLAVIGELLSNDPTLKLEIQGHTDNVGAKAANLALSQARAASVRDYLVKTFGVTPDRLTSAGFGDSRPIADNATEEGRAKNRRVELVKK